VIESPFITLIKEFEGKRATSGDGFPTVEGKERQIIEPWFLDDKHLHARWSGQRDS